MTAFSDHTSRTQHEDAPEHIKQLLHAINENSRKLTEVRRQRQHVEDEITQCTRETERRVDLLIEKSEVVDMLQQMGCMLQEESHLSDQLNGQASEDRNQKRDLQERSERFTNKARGLTAEILEVKQHLAEARARNMAAEALIHAPTSKSKQNQGEPK
ncbi:GRB10-interacting GYF protein 2-like [Lates japonicus]|uniref:GRB10-interacting GYF protein 2-like protein n=1 Tax=Lates japonicus TaxID=270547 RepID=A0AAD3R104_LATJO|nr:GRB10-interacting GYF protein 2-like protein [Lates japonicus]